jgi:trehalose 6-phosphate phosphatase
LDRARKPGVKLKTVHAHQEIDLTSPARRTHWSLPDAQATRAAWSLFLDVDGTLLEIAPTPDAVKVDDSLLMLMSGLQHALGGAVALVSGRPLLALDALFSPLVWPAAGTHGLERRDATGRIVRCRLPAGELTAARDQLAQLARINPGTLLEDKGCALALHYRAVPGCEAGLRRAVLEIVAALGPDYHVLEGKSVLEIKPVMFNKADAIRAFMREPPFAGRRPVFVGDDFTDLDGFAAVEAADGISVSVGDRIDGQVRLASPREVHAFLVELSAGRLVLP